MWAATDSLLRVANLNNPAGRLLYWLEAANNLDHGVSAMAQWCRVFDLDSDNAVDRVECLLRAAMLMRLAQRVRADAEALPKDLHAGRAIESLTEIERALDQLTIMPGNNLGSLFTQIQGTGWQSLRWLDDVFAERSLEQAIDPEEIQKHLTSVRGLIDDVLHDQELEVALKQYILARLRDIEKALIDSFVTGADGLKVAVSAPLGDVQMNPDWWDRISKTKWSPRIAGVWMAIVTTLGAAGGVPALLPGGDPAPVVVTNQTTVQIENNATVINPEPEQADVVDAEIVDEPEGPPDDPG